MRTRTKASAVYGFDDPLLFEHSIAYLVEVGHWVPSEPEVAGLRRWLQRGGFLLVDDFREGDITNFEEQLKRVLPDAVLLPVPKDHPIWDSSTTSPTSRACATPTAGCRPGSGGSSSATIPRRG